MVKSELDNLLRNPNQLMQLVSKLLTNNRIVWSTYDRYSIETTLKENSYVFSAIQKIAKACVNIDLLVGRYDREWNFEIDPANGLYQLLKHPNPIMDEMEFKEQMAFWYYAFGECFVYANRYIGGNNAGQVMPGGLFYAPPQITDIKANGIIPTGYVINLTTSYQQSIDAYNMIHLKAFNPDWDDLHGLPFLEVAGKLIDKLDAADETEVKNFQNGGPAYIATARDVDGFKKEEYEGLVDRLKKLWKDPKNRGGIAGTSAAIDLKEVGKSPVDLGTIDSTKNTLRMLCAVWGLDPGLFDTEASTYNNKQEINRSIYTEAAIPIMTRFASKLTHWLGEAYGGVEVIIDTSNVEVLQPNVKSKIEWMMMSNTFTDNEIREATGYDKRDSEVSDLTPSERMEQEAVAGFDEENLSKNIIA